MEIKFLVAEAKFPIDLPLIPGFVVSSPKIKRGESDIKILKTQKGAAFGFGESTLDRAISEAVERFSISIYKKESFLLASSNELNRSFLAPNNFILFSERQYQLKKIPYTHPSSLEKIYWIRGIDVSNQEKVYMPACFVFPDPKGGWAQFDKWTSNGLAAGKDESTVVLNGICELVERDAIMCWWMTRKNAIRIPTDYFNQYVNVKKLITLLQKYNYDLSIFFIRNDMGMITAVAQIKSGISNVCAFGSSCKLELSQAVESAILEALMVARTQKILQKRKYRVANIENFIDHVMVPVTKKYKKNFSFIEKWKKAKSAMITEFIKEHPTTRDQIMEKISQVGYLIYFVNVTPGILKNSGYFICKTLIPGLHPLESNHNFLHLDLRRLSRFCGYPLNLKDVNMNPHPFG